jgi:DNA-binding CsgD family transcriptional regulator
MFEINQTVQLGVDTQTYVLRKSRLTKTVVKPKQVFVDSRQIEPLIELLYEIPLGGATWSEWLGQLRQMLRADYACLGVGGGSDSEGLLCTGNNDQSAVRQALEASELTGLPVNEVIAIEECIGKSWLQSPIYLEQFKPLNIRHILGVDISNEWGIAFPLRILRSGEQGPYSEQDKKLCRLLVPHLQRSIKFFTQHAHKKSKLKIVEDMLNHAGLGMIFYSADGFVSESNAQARRIIAENDGISFGSCERHLHIDDQGRADELREILKAAVRKSANGSVVGPVGVISLKKKDANGYIYASVWSASRRHADRFAVMFIQASHGSLPAYVQDMARKMFGLSPKQAKLATLLMEGHSLNQAAVMQGNSINTMRSHRDEVLFKAAVNRQSHLMRLMLRDLFLA